MKKFNLILLLCFMVGCSNLSQNLENNSPTTFIAKKREYCPTSNNYFLIENTEATNFLLSNYGRSYLKNRSFIEQFILLGLIELQRRPDVVSPHSRLQIIGKINNQFYFYDFKNKETENNFPFLFGLNYLSHKFSNLKLEVLANELDQNLDEVIPVDIELEKFITAHKKQILKNKLLASNYLKADEPITHFENINKTKIANFIRKLNNTKKLSEDQYVFTNDSISTTPVKCNFEYKNENNFDYLKGSIKKESSHYYGLKNGNNYLIGIMSNFEPEEISNIEDTPFFKKDINEFPTPICFLQKNNKHIFLASIEGRAKNQHLSHLIDYDISLGKDINSIIDTLNFPRHLFLTNPDRILYEVNRCRLDQLNFFLSMNFPIYYANNLGNIIGTFESENSNYLFFDSRSKSGLSCQE